MKNPIITAVILCSLFIAGCSTTTGNKHLAFTEWSLDEIIYADSSYTITPPGEMSILFFDSTTVTVTGACNHYFGVYSLEGEDNINIETRGGTLAYCPELELEERYISILNLTNIYKENNGELRLESQQNRVTLVFKPKF